MAFKFIALFALVASSSAGVLKSHRAYSDAPSVSYSSISTPEATHGSPSYAAPVYKVAAPVAPTYKVSAPTAFAPVPQTIYSEHFEPAHYNFEYTVADPHTGDSKSHHETREGDVTKGYYSLIEADGSKRIVEYTVDAHSGFNAVVRKEPAQGYNKVATPFVAKVDAPVAFAAPVVKVAAPVYAKVAEYPAPIATKTAYSNAPEVSYSSISSSVSHEAPSYYH